MKATLRFWLWPAFLFLIWIRCCTRGACACIVPFDSIHIVGGMRFSLLSGVQMNPHNDQICGVAQLVHFHGCECVSACIKQKVKLPF